MRKKNEYNEMEYGLCSIANNPNFTDMERNWADELWTSLKNAEEPKSDWKTLDVNDLSDCPDILVGNYEVQEMDDKNEYHTIIVGYTGTILLNMQSRNAKYRYRLKPTKKSNEELAEDYAKKVDKRSARVISFEEIVALREGFISGRKSMESEKVNEVKA